MKLTAKSSQRGLDVFEVETKRPQTEAIVILSAFERELDALLSFMDEKRNVAVSETIIRRFLTAEEIHEDVSDAIRRIDIKMEMIGSRIAGSKA